MARHLSTAKHRAHRTLAPAILSGAIVGNVAAVVTFAMVVIGAPAMVAGHATMAPMAACAQEDGSGPQELPCLWDATVRGNGIGQSYILTR